MADFTKFFNDIATGTKWGVGVTINRTNSLPIDANSIFPSKALADAYATGVEATINTAIAAYKASHADSKIEKLTNNSYVGQILTVIDNDVATVYVIEANRTLKAVGTAYNDQDLRNLITDLTVIINGQEEVRDDEGNITQEAVEGIVDKIGVKSTPAQGTEGEENYIPAVEATGIYADIENINNAIDNINTKIGEIPTEEKDGEQVPVADSVIDYIDLVADNYVEKESGKGLSTNDLTDDLKANYDAAYTHSQAPHAPVNAQANVIEQIKVNGTAQEITDKVVDITVPTKVSDLTNDSGFLTKVPEYSITKDETSTDYAAVYHLTQTIDGTSTNIGAAINIPKDMVVQSGSVITDPEGQPAGTYIEILFQNQDTPVYINVGDLIEYVTSGSNTGDMVVISIDNDHKVTATITDGTITKAKLNATVQASLEKADSALQSSDIADLVTNNHTHANKGVLDNLTQAVIDNSHSHANSTVLAGITADLVSQWSDAEVNVINGVSSEFTVVTDSSNDRVLEIAQIAATKVVTGTDSSNNPITLDATITAITDSIEAIYKAGEGEEPATGVLVDTIGTPATFKTVTETKTDDAGEEITVTKEVVDVDGTGIYANTYSRKQIELLIADITGGESAADVLAALNTYKGTNDNRVKTIEDTAITGITVDGTAVTVTSNIAAIELPIATESAKGVVKSSEAENKVSVDADGIMEVKTLNANRLVQTTGEWLILNGGNADLSETAASETEQ